MTAKPTPFAPSFFHGAKADLKGGDLIGPGRPSNFGEREEATHVYMSATLDAAVWGAELARGEGRGRIYVVEPTGSLEDDPDLTDKRFPGNPSRSYRSRDPVRVIGEVIGWEAHTPEQLKAMKDGLRRLEGLGAKAPGERS